MGEGRRMITVVVGKEIEKIKGDFESYLNGLNMVGEISYSQYSKLYDEGTKQMQRAYELGKSELEKENAELKDKLKNLESVAEVRLANWQKYEEENKELKTQAKKIILKLYNVGRDVLMCRADEAAYDNLSTAINDRSIEQFLKENNNEQARI